LKTFSLKKMYHALSSENNNEGGANDFKINRTILQHETLTAATSYRRDKKNGKRQQ
jgi:hypothetical protein